MRLVVEVSHLNRALSFIKGCVPSKSTLPILQHVLFCAEGSTLTVRAMNPGREAEASCPAQMDDGGLFTLPGKLLCALVAGFSSGAQVSFTRKAGDRIEITSGTSKFVLRSLEPQDFPALQSYLGDAPISFSADPKAFADLLGSVAYASEKDLLVRPDMYGVHLYADAKKLIALSSDVSRLARRQMDCPSGAESLTASILIGLENVHEVVSALKGIQEPMIVKVGPSVIEFATQTLRLTLGLSGKPLPAPFRISTKVDGVDFTVHPVALKEAVERCQQVYAHAPKKIEYQDARLRASDKTLTVSMGETEMDTASEEIEAGVTEAKTLCVNVRFLAEMLRQWPEDGEMNVYHGTAGIYFSSPKHPDLLAMIQRLRPRKASQAEAA